MLNNNLQVGLQLIGAGMHVFVTGPDSKPRVKWREQSTRDPETLRTWFKQWPDSLVAIDLAKDGLVVLDGDRHGGPDGVAGLSQIFKDHGLDTSAIPLVITQRNGRHAYFTQPREGEPLGNRDKAVRDSGINVRGHGGYVNAAGINVPGGGEYRRHPNTPDLISSFKHGIVPVLPPSLVELLRGGTAKVEEAATAVAQRATAATASPYYEAKASPYKLNGSERSRTEAEREEAYANTALRNQTVQLAGMLPESGRNNELNTAALKMGHQVAAGRIDQVTVEGQLYQASVANGLVKDTGARAVRDTIASGLKAGLKEPSPPLRDRPLNGPERLLQAMSLGFPDMTETGKIRNTCNNVRHAIGLMGITCQYNQFHDKLLIGGQPIGQYAGELSDHACLVLRKMIEEQYVFDPGREKIFDACVQLCLETRFDPIVDYLDSLKWDPSGQPLADNLSRCSGNRSQSGDRQNCPGRTSPSRQAAGV